MKKKLNILVLSTLLACLVPANAQDFTQPRDPAIQSQKIMTTGAAYSGTVYEPFNNTTPADQSYAPAQAPNGPRRTSSYGDLFDYGADQGKSEQFPIGDAMLPLLLMSAAFAGVIYVRKRKNAQSGARV